MLAAKAPANKEASPQTKLLGVRLLVSLATTARRYLRFIRLSCDTFCDAHFRKIVPILLVRAVEVWLVILI